MKRRLLRLLIKFTKCSVHTDGEKISLEWTWHGNSLKWVSLAPADMRIIIVDENTIHVVKSDLKNLIGELRKKRDRHKYSKW